MSNYLDSYHEKWITDMFEYLKIPVPDRETCIRLSKEANAWIIPQVKSAYPGMNELVKKLAPHFSLYTSSGSDNEMLKTYYKFQDINHCFKTLYSSDLLRVFKSHPEYFSRLFEDSGVDPKTAIIIDDKAKVLDLVKGFGAKCILSNLSGDVQNNEKYPMSSAPEELLIIIFEITGIDL